MNLSSSSKSFADVHCVSPLEIQENTEKMFFGFCSPSIGRKGDVGPPGGPKWQSLISVQLGTIRVLQK